MSKTYNSKYKFNKEYGMVNYPNGYTVHSPTCGDINYSSDKDYDYDYSHSTWGSTDNSNIKSTRHPNKKRKKGVLTREFHKVGLADPSKYKNRFGDAYDKSNRTYLSRYELAHRRRHRMKEEEKNIIDNALNEDV